MRNLTVTRYASQAQLLEARGVLLALRAYIVPALLRDAIKQEEQDQDQERRTAVSHPDTKSRKAW